MAYFLVQCGSNDLQDEERFLRKILNSEHYLHKYKSLSLEELLRETSKELIPVGTIDFVTTYLRKVYGIVKQNPIEIPKYLRTEEFLKRDYTLVSWDRLPRHGKYFVKDVSVLKSFGMVIQTDYFITDELFNHQKKNEFGSTLVLSKEHTYLVSSLYDIQAEYRVYVMQGEIEAICLYNGNCTILPDIPLINKAVCLINHNEKWLKSYTIDVMVGPKGTAIIEIHNFSSVGLYSTLWGRNLPYAYVNGIDYILNDNHLLEV